MNVMSLMATIGVDIKQYEKDLQKVSQVTKRFMRNGKDSQIDIDISVDTGKAESQIDDIISLVSTANSSSIDIDANANLYTDDYTSGIDTITGAAKDAEVDVDGDATLNIGAYDDNVDTIEKTATNADVDVDGDADLDITSYNSGIDDIEKKALDADVDVNGEANLDITSYTSGIDDIEKEASGADVDVDGEATIDIGAYTDNIDTIERDATNAAADVDGFADLNIDDYQTGVTDVEKLASGAAADITGTATITASVIGDEQVDELVQSIGEVESSSGSADSALRSIGQGISFQNVTSALDSIAGSLQGIISRAAQAGKALVDMSVDASDWGDTILTESQEYGIDTTTIQQMRYASRFVDTEVSAIEGSWQYMTRQLASGSDTALDAYKQLGVATTDMNGKMRPTQDIFWDTVDALHEMGDGAEREAIMSQTLGRNYTQLNPLVKAGSEAYQDYMEKAYVVDEERVNQLGEYNDAVQDLTANAEATKLQFMADLAPAFAEASTALSDFLSEFNSFMQTEEGRAAVESLRDAISGLIESVTGDINIEDVFSKLTGAVEKFTDAVKWIGENSGTVIAAFEGIVAALAGIKVTSGLLKVIELVKGLKNLKLPWSGGDSGGDITPTAPASGGSGFFGNILQKGAGFLSKIGSGLISSGWAGPLAGFALAYPGSRIVDNMGVERSRGKEWSDKFDTEEYYQAMDQVDNDHVTRMQESLGRLNKVQQMEDDADSTEADRLAEAKNVLSELGEAIEEFLPDLESIQKFKQNHSEHEGESGFNWGEALNDPNVKGDEVIEVATTAYEGLIEKINEAKEAGSEVGENVATSLDDAVTEFGTALDEVAGEERDATISGDTSIEEISIALDEAIGKERTLNIKLGVTGGGRLESLLDLNGNTRRHATAMSRGEILRGLTPFGMDANGTMHYGGESGAEAVVGVNSLDHMIQESVRNAIGAVLGKMDQLIGGQNQGDVKIVMNNGALVGQMVKEMDRQLGSTARRRGGGRT